METKNVHPEIDKESFNCPHCKALTHHFWSEVYWYLNGPKQSSKTLTCAMDFKIAQCYTCNKYSIWRCKPRITSELDTADIYEMIYPINLSYFPDPNDDLANEIKEDYLEAGKVLKDSPRGACSLLRLSLEKLINQVEPGSGNIDFKIKKLVEKGLETPIQEALDLTRVIGNEAVHAGTLDLKGNKETALILFETINLISEKLISLPKRINGAYKSLPPEKLDAIKKRDKK
jgi:hypothetical protein